LNLCKCLALKTAGLLLSLAALPALLPAQDNAELRQILEIKTDNPRFMPVKPGVNITAAEFLSRYKAALGLGPEDELVEQQVTDEAKMNMRHYRYQQLHNGLPVMGGDLLLHEKNGKLYLINGEVIPKLPSGGRSVMPEAAALQKALDFYGATQQEKSKDTNSSGTHQHAKTPAKGSLMYVKNKAGKYVLSYKFELAVHGAHDRKAVFIDAANGEIVFDYSLVCQFGAGNSLIESKSQSPVQQPEWTKNMALGSPSTGLALTWHNGPQIINTEYNDGDNLYYLRRIINDTASIKTSYFFSENWTDEDNNWGLSFMEAADVHWGMGKVYDYFNTIHGRKSYDNKDSRIINKIIEKDYMDGTLAEAFYNDELIEFWFGIGDEINRNPLTSLPVVGHEFTHAVTDYSAKLIYAGESGALNESFSDIMGMAIEHHVIPEKFNWEIGEEIIINGTALRSAENPKSVKEPDTYLGQYWTSDVHESSAVQNHWFYILCNGKTGVNDLGNAYSVKGIGIEKATAIAYRNLTTYLRPSSNYQDARACAIQAAIDLFDGFCSFEHVQTQNAWYAVGLGHPALMIEALTLKDAACGINNGIAEITAVKDSTLLAPTIYTWSHSADVTGPIAINLEGNQTYSVTATDMEYGCQTDTTFFLADSAGFQIDLLPTPATCGQANGEIEVQTKTSQKHPLGPNSGFFVLNWSNGANTSPVTGLFPGIYSVTVFDVATGCEVLGSATVGAADLPIQILGGGARRYCIGDNDNTVRLEAIADNCILCDYQWSTGEAGQAIIIDNFNELYIETYTVTVTNLLGCSGTASTAVEKVPYDCNDCSLINRLQSRITGTNLCNEWRINILRSRDPNDMLGPPGYGEPRWVSVNDRLPYTIRFENDPNAATAPAQKVVIEHVPDEDLNLFSFQLGDFGFANQIFTVPPNQTYYSKRLDLRDSLGVYVDVNAGIDITQNKVFWIFQSVDPATGLPPTSPLLGLLPVNDTLLHNGEGFVNFTIKPKTTAATGDTVLAKAAIVFDQNETIYTPEIFNVIDAVAPVSQIVTVLPAETDSLHHELCWTAQDDSGGCGLRDYALYVSQNGGSFYRHLDGIADTCTTFTGSPGSTYAFYTLASDNVGNTEALKPQGDTEVSINDAWRLFFYSINLDTFCAGDSIDLRWLATRVTGVDLFYSPDGAATLEPLADDLDAGAGFGWRIPDNHPGCTACAFIVADTAGLISDTVFAVIQPRPDIVPITDITDAGCPGSDNGAITITAGGGTAPYTYLWNNGQSTNPATGLIADTYTIVLTDAAGCSTSASAAVGEPAALLLGTTVANESCDGGADGAITLSVEGGTSPYSYLWSNSETTANISALAAGDYSVVVTDANACTAAATATVSPGAPEDLLTTAAIKVLLQGPYIAAVQLMHDSLRVKNLIPLTEPYTGMTGFTHTGGGGEQTTLAVLAVTGNNAIVDWVFLELRDDANPVQVLATRSALLQRDGDVVGVDGMSPVRFNVPTDSSYFLAVRHRNHLGVQLGSAVEYPVCDVVQTDFTTTPPEGFFDFNGLNPAQKTVSGKYVLWAGNGRIDTQLKYNGSNNDRTTILSVVGLTTPNAIVPGYLLADYNLDGAVKYNGAANDRNVLLGNVGITTPSAVVHDQVAR
jgi:Zn-dependent metalloprotease